MQPQCPNLYLIPIHKISKHSSGASLHNTGDPQFFPGEDVTKCNCYMGKCLPSVLEELNDWIPFLLDTHQDSKPAVPSSSYSSYKGKYRWFTLVIAVVDGNYFVQQHPGDVWVAAEAAQKREVFPRLSFELASDFPVESNTERDRPCPQCEEV